MEKPGEHLGEVCSQKIDVSGPQHQREVQRTRETQRRWCGQGESRRKLVRKENQSEGSSLEVVEMNLDFIIARC